MVIVAMDGRCTLTGTGHVGYAFLIGRHIELMHGNKLLVAMEAPRKVHVALKASTKDDIADCRDLLITPFRPISNREPIEITVAAPAGAKVFGCNADGTAILEVKAPFNPQREQLSFTTPNREDVAFYVVRRQND
jgi:hypothetical protein